MKNLWIALVVAILPLGGLAESSQTTREPAAKKEKTVKKAKSSKKASSKKSAKKAKKAKKIKSKATHKSHAPRMEEPAAASVGEIPESMKDDLPPPNNGDLTE